jgi:hypothetical protein
MDSSQNHHHTGEPEFNAEYLLVPAGAGDGAATKRLPERYRNDAGSSIQFQGRCQLRKVVAESPFHDIGRKLHPKIATSRGSSMREFLMGVLRMFGSIRANRVRHCRH